MLPDSYEDCLTCHVEIEGAVISFEIGNTTIAVLRDSGWPCHVLLEQMSNTLFRCIALFRQVHAQVLRSKHPGSHLGMEIDPFVSGLVRVPLKL